MRGIVRPSPTVSPHEEGPSASAAPPSRRPPSPCTALALAAALAVPQAAHGATTGLGSPEAAETGEDAGASSDDPQLERAMAAFERGTRAYDEGRYEDALVAFQDAATLYASADFQYNIGLCFEKLDQLDEAIRAFETYLRTKADPPDRASVEDRVARLRAEVQRRKREEAERIEAEREAAVQAAELDGPKPARPLIVAGAALVGLGTVVALGGGTGFGIAARRRSHELDEIQDGGNPGQATFADARDLEREGKRFEALQVTFAAVGAAVAITGVALIAVGLQRRRAQAAETARMQLVPGLSTRSAGLSLVGRF
jgi:tetratricopeptide (TPR) repeat protein